jgi:serine/threonine protein kinase
MTLLDGSFEVVETGAAANRNSNAMTVRTDQRLTDHRLPNNDEDPDVLIGESFGHFELVSTLGRGGMGQVYRALDKSLQRYVAVKLLRSGIGNGIGNGSSRLSRSSDAEIDKLLQEAIAQARVSHPNVVTIYYVGKQEGHPFLAMELVNGKPLSGRIADGNLTFTDIASLAGQITEALRFSYELDIIHGDIKPSNVLVQPNGVAKLSDFGMARRVSSASDEAIGGTPNYIAPELLKGANPSLQSDVYALGVTLFEMTFSRLPITITGSSISQWIDAHENGRPQFPDHWPDQLPEAWRDLLAKMLARDADERYTSYDDLLVDLTRLAPRSQVIARPFPRIVAAGIDWISVMILVLGIQAAFSNSSWNPLVTNVLHVLDFVPIMYFA